MWRIKKYVKHLFMSDGLSYQNWADIYTHQKVINTNLNMLILLVFNYHKHAAHRK